MSITAPWADNDNPFKPAVREAVKARIALTGPAGSGKTFTALAIATDLAEKVAVVDTEHGRALEHQGRFEFDHFAPTRFHPLDLCEMLAKAAYHNYGCVIIDSLSHYWMGPGGALEIVATNTQPGGKMSGWQEYGPIERQLIEAILSYPGHIIATMRVKTAYVIETDEHGKSKVRKAGLEAVQRKDMDYEFSLVGQMDADHRMTVTKAPPIPALTDAVIDRPGGEVAETLLNWISGGKQLPNALEYRARALDKDATYVDLRALHGEVKDRGLLGAMVLDEDRNASTLGDLLNRRGRALKPMAVAA